MTFNVGKLESLSLVVGPAMTLTRKHNYLRRPTGKGRHYSFGNILRDTLMTSHTNSYSILVVRCGSVSSGKFPNALSNASSMIGLDKIEGLSVLATNVKAVRVVGLVRPSDVVSKLVFDNCVHW